MISDKLYAEWLEAEQRPFEGFDFSYFSDKCIDEQPPWSYSAMVREEMADIQAVLDIGTGGAEFLMTFQDIFPDYVVALEGHPPNLKLAQKRLEPLGGAVLDFSADEERRMPLDDGRFDLVLDRHMAYNVADVERVLKPGGCFLTQQVDGRNFDDFSACFECEQYWTYFTLDYALNKLRTESHLIVEEAEEWTGRMIFFDVATLIYFIQAVPWLIPPGFTVDKYRPHLAGLQARLEKEGELAFTQRRFFIQARKPGELC